MLFCHPSPVFFTLFAGPGAQYLRLTFSYGRFLSRRACQNLVRDTMMQVNVGNGTPATRLTCILISTHDPARLRLHVLAREGSVGCDTAGRFPRHESLLGPHLACRLVIESICWL